MWGFFSNGEKLDRVGSRSPKRSSFPPKRSSLFSLVGVLTRFDRFSQTRSKRRLKSPSFRQYQTRDRRAHVNFSMYTCGHVAHKPHTLKDRGGIRIQTRYVLPSLPPEQWVHREPSENCQEVSRQGKEIGSRPCSCPALSSHHADGREVEFTSGTDCSDDSFRTTSHVVARETPVKQTISNVSLRRTRTTEDKL